MIRLNRLTDYGVVVMSQMAARDDLRSAQQISDSTAIPLPTVSKILNALSHADLVVAQRGASGGYRLVRPAERIAVSEVIQALEGPIALTACVEGAESHCDVERLCPMSGGWNKVNTAIRDALATVSLADMAGIPEAFLVPRDSGVESEKNTEITNK
ncbi:MAG: SUF system Fe-S cluster assembly regulator [Rhodovibrionaceae bacterium]